MTPFGIRNKIKAALGLGGAPNKTSGNAKAEKPRYPVTFVKPDGSEFTVEAKKGDSIVMASGRGEYPVPTGCADSTCGTCRVDVLAGGESLSPADDHERQVKKSNAVPEDMRLGCQVAILGPGVKLRIHDPFQAAAGD